MGKQYDRIESKQTYKRPRWLTVCMMATAASVIALAGCGDNEESVAPTDETSPLEQDTTQPGSSMNEEPAMEQDPGSSEGSASESSMTKSAGAESEAPMPEQGMSGQGMPEDTMDEPVEGTMNPEEDEAGFGEGTAPMPGVEDDESSTSNQ